MTAVLVPIPVASVAEEDMHLGQCECGGRWHLVAEEVAPINRRWYDALVLRCERCRDTNRAIFDITRFFEPSGNAWARAK
jgi:hypothetical protein